MICNRKQQMKIKLGVPFDINLKLFTNEKGIVTKTM